MENDAFNLHRSTTDLMRDVKTLLGHVERLKIDVANIKNGSHQRVNMPQQITPLANQIKSHLSEIFIKVDKFNNDHRRNASEEVEAAIQEWNRLKAEQDALFAKKPQNYVVVVCEKHNLIKIPSALYVNIHPRKKSKLLQLYDLQ